ncbi:MAG: hypothetical protein HKN07_11565 [Acidimicrobiia bacterium]|nr:zinc finger Ran-binding domain-containing protein [Acidimicrobiia bacterium]NNF64878.1 hypothetical protein [Acidimicrobiia bacterium]
MNATNVEWCGQCYASFVAVSTVAGAAPERTTAPSWPERRPGQWTCLACETSNEVDAVECMACGTSIFSAIAPPDAETVRPLTASAFALPGLALMRVGRSIEGSLVFLLAAAGLIAGLIIPSIVAKVLLVGFIAVLWVLGSRDATSRQPVLTIPVLRWVMVGFGSAILVAFLILSAVGSRAS